ncbi:TonB-dependent receptor plug domain-containing protein [Caulobacter segnis]
MPISITSVSADRLEQSNFRSVTDLPYLVPGVQFETTNGTAFNIRGVGSTSWDFSNEKSVSLVVDDVVMDAQRDNGLTGLADIQQIDVLMGPQGTLFGKNATSGVIAITTVKPALGVFSVKGDAAYGERDDRATNLTVNIPLGDKLALRVSSFAQGQDGLRPLHRAEPVVEHLQGARLSRQAAVRAQRSDRADLFQRLFPSLGQQQPHHGRRRLGLLHQSADRQWRDAQPEERQQRRQQDGRPKEHKLGPGAAGSGPDWTRHPDLGHRVSRHAFVRRGPRRFHPGRQAGLRAVQPGDREDLEVQPGTALGFADRRPRRISRRPLLQSPGPGRESSPMGDLRRAAAGDQHHHDDRRGRRSGQRPALPHHQHHAGRLRPAGNSTFRTSSACRSAAATQRTRTARLKASSIWTR